MGFNDWIMEGFFGYKTETEFTMVCKNCGKKYRQHLVEQTAGCRDYEDDVCPYCGHVNATSMEVEFHNSKL